MNTLRTLLSLPALALTLLVVAAGPAAAAETSGEKIELFDWGNPHELVGAIILGIAALLAFAALVNAVRQLGGKRGQADGKFRWR